MIILGVSFDYHDAAAALICDGEVVCAIQEERLTRIKHDPVLPKRAISACLSKAGLTTADIDAVVFYENPIVKFDRICRTAIMGFPKSFGNFQKSLKSWLESGKFDPRRRLAKLLDIDPNKIHYCDHHLSHAASAFYCSPFDEATVVTLDGVGEYETAVIFRADKNGIKRVKSTKFPDSLGLFYSGITAYLGFEVNEGEFKVMGMAAFGKPIYYNKIRPLIQFKNGRIRVDQSYFTFRNPKEMPYSEKLVSLLGEARVSGAQINLSAVDEEVSDDPDSIRYSNIAASVQKVAEEIILEFVEYATKRTGISNLCMAGGVALNSLANGKLQCTRNGGIYIHSSPGDSGGAIGGAFIHYHKHAPAAEKKPQRNPYLGLSYSERTVLQAVRNYASDEVIRYDTTEAMIGVVAGYLAEGKVIGWMQGCFEWGPRALGARSILASPTFPDMKDRVNRQIKFREPFRPFAPSVLAEEAARYFEMPGPDYPARPEDYMLSVCPVREAYHDKIPAIVHVDGTARVQTVREDLSPVYHALIKKVGECTGIPIVMNTSFNLRGEPIVSSPKDAMQTFELSEMDYLVMGNVVVSRPSVKKCLQRIISTSGGRKEGLIDA